MKDFEDLLLTRSIKAIADLYSVPEAFASQVGRQMLKDGMSDTDMLYDLDEHCKNWEGRVS